MEAPFDTPVVCPVLIGRAPNLAALCFLIDRAKNGEGQLALLCGEADIGKSRLVAEAKIYAAQRDFLLLEGHCFQTDSAFPYAPLLDLFRHVVRDLDFRTFKPYRASLSAEGER